MNSWLSSKSNRHRKTPSNSPSARDHVRLGPSDASSVSQSTAGPTGNLTSASDIPPDEFHTHINDPSIYAPTPSLIHSKDGGSSNVPANLDTTPQRVSEPEATNPFTPQDAVITQVFGKSAPPATDPTHVHATPPLNAPQPPVSLGPTLTVYDPFSGAKLGEHTPISPSTVAPGSGSGSGSVSLPNADDRKLWSSLERILELQAEITVMHADMEGVGRGWGSNAHASGIWSVGEGNARSRKRSMRRGRTLPVGDEEHEPEGGTMGVAVSEVSTVPSDGEEDDEDDEEDEDDIRGHGKRRRDGEFVRLAEQFAQRKAAIGGIMNKLDALSTALKTFHTLPPPIFDLATSPSRTGTMSSAPSVVPPASPPVLPARVSSLPPSASLSQAGNPVTPPILLCPPDPPISTLAPLASSRGPRVPTPPALEPAIAPVLPQPAVPMIMTGTPYVESPAEMHRDIE